MKRGIVVLFLLIVGNVFAGSRFSQKTEGREYVVLTSRAVAQDEAWNKVVEALCALHDAEVVYYSEKPAEALGTLKQVRPRYVALVEKPERIDRNFIAGMHVVARSVTSSVYVDFIWGIVTGLDADMAMKLVDNSKEPLVLRNGLVSQDYVEMKEIDWDRFAYISRGNSGMKRKRSGKLAVETWNSEKQFEMFNRYYQAVEPNFLLSESYVPKYYFSLPNNNSVPEKIYAEDGIFHYSAQEVSIENGKVYHTDTLNCLVDWSGGRKVHIAAGSFGCDVECPEKSCALAWMGSPNVTAMVGYPINRVALGQAVWGGLKFWCATPGRYTMAEAYFLSQQHLLHRLADFSPLLLDAGYDPLEFGDLSALARDVDEKVGEYPGVLVGFLQERDLLAYFGDPKWDVRFRPGKESYTVKTAREGDKYIITLATKKNFSPDQVEGTFMRTFDVDDLGTPNTIDGIPFSFIFPERLKNPRLAPGQDWQVALSEDMMLIYEAWFEPGKTYEIVLTVD